jgi:hypothetical protein
MLKMRERCSTRSDRSPARLLVRLALFAFFVSLACTTAGTARAAAKRIALIHADRELSRSVELALYPWDIAVIEIREPPPDSSDPNPRAAAKALAVRYRADAVAWIERSSEAAVLWFFDSADGSLRSRPLPAATATAEDDPAQLAAVALTLKTLVRAAPWESRIPTVAREQTTAGWAPRLELDALGRTATSGTSGEPRIGVWVSAWYGTPKLAWGAALGTSAGLGMTFDGAAGDGTLQDIDVRAALRAHARFGRDFFVEPSLGAAAHVERAEISTKTPVTTQTYTRVDPSLDAGLSLGWQVTPSFAWSIGVEALGFLRYQRWLAGSEVVFDPSPLWLEWGSSIGWTFR